MTKKQKTTALLFLISQGISLLGSQTVALAVASYLPQFCLSFFGGTLADMFGRKKVILLADSFIALVTLSMLLLMPSVPERMLPLALLAMALLRSVGAGIQTPAVAAALPLLVTSEELERWNGINASIQSLVQFASPAIAAAILGVASLRSTLMLDVITACLGMGVLGVLAIPRAASAEKTAPIRQELTAGLGYIKTQSIIRRSLIVYGFFVFLTVPAGYLAGLLVSRIFGDNYGYLAAVELAGFGGMVLGGVLMSLKRRERPYSKSLMLWLLLFGGMAAAMGLCRVFPLYLALMVAYGVALTALQTLLTAALQRYSEEAMQGRVLGAMSALYAGSYPLGMAIFGPLADAVPLQYLMVGSGIALAALALWSRGAEK